MKKTKLKTFTCSACDKKAPFKKSTWLKNSPDFGYESACAVCAPCAAALKQLKIKFFDALIGAQWVGK